MLKIIKTLFQNVSLLAFLSHFPIILSHYSVRKRYNRSWSSQSTTDLLLNREGSISANLISHLPNYLSMHLTTVPPAHSSSTNPEPSTVKGVSCLINVSFVFSFLVFGTEQLGTCRRERAVYQTRNTTIFIRRREPYTSKVEASQFNSYIIYIHIYICVCVCIFSMHVYFLNKM